MICSEQTQTGTPVTERLASVTACPMWRVTIAQSVRKITGKLRVARAVKSVHVIQWAPLVRSASFTMDSATAGKGLEAGSVTSARKDFGETPSASAFLATAVPWESTQNTSSAIMRRGNAFV